VANSQTVALRRGRINAELRRAALDNLALLDIKTDAHTDAHVWAETLIPEARLCRASMHSLYVLGGGA
jgi:hypothetical protein